MGLFANADRARRRPGSRIGKAGEEQRNPSLSRRLPSKGVIMRTEADDDGTLRSPLTASGHAEAFYMAAFLVITYGRIWGDH